MFHRLIILLLKDEFNDFEELKLVTPVRDEAYLLFTELQLIESTKEEFVLILNFLFPLLKLVETANWCGRYNLFLIIKGLLTSFKKEIFQGFGKVFIESLLILEEEPRTIVTEIIEMLVPEYFQLKEQDIQISQLLKNL